MSRVSSVQGQTHGTLGWSSIPVLLGLFSPTSWETPEFWANGSNWSVYVTFFVKLYGADAQVSES